MRYWILMLLCSVAVALPAQTYEEYVDKAYEMARADSLSQAETLIKEALKLKPTHPYNAILFARLGVVQQGLNKPNEALESYNYSLNLAPESVSTLLQRAALLLEMGKPDQAYTDYCEVLDHEKDCVEALSFRAFIQLRRQEYKSARVDFNHLLKLDEHHYQALMGMGLSYQKEQHYDDALTYYNRLVEAYPKDKDAYVARAELYLEMKKPSLAKADLQTAIELGASPAALRDLLKKCK